MRSALAVLAMLLGTFLGHHPPAPAAVAVAHLDAYVTGQAAWRGVPTVYRLRPGEGYATIESADHVSYAELAAANPWVQNADDLPVGYPVVVPPAGWTPDQGERGANTAPKQGEGVPDQGGSEPSNGWVPVPGMPDAYSKCIEMRESSDNPRSVNSIPGYIGNGGGLFGDLKSTWAGYGGYAQPFQAPVSEQVAFNARLYQEDGTSPWTADGCQLDGTVRS